MNDEKTLIETGSRNDEKTLIETGSRNDEKTLIETRTRNEEKTFVETGNSSNGITPNLYELVEYWPEGHWVTGYWPIDYWKNNLFIITSLTEKQKYITTGCNDSPKSFITTGSTTESM